jgi:hypothetical protein
MNRQEAQLQCIKQRKLEAKMIREEYWRNLTRFTNPDDIPELPVVDEKEWKEFYVPILIKCGAIPKKQLIKGETYLGTCRNADKAEWTGKEFIYKRTKFGCTYNETINHFEDDNGYDLFVPLIKL